MSRCQRHDAEGLTGFPPTPEWQAHLGGCADCQAAEQKIRRLESLLQATGKTAQPPPGWELRLQHRLSGARARRWPSVAAVGGALAAMVLAVVALRPGAPAHPVTLHGELLATGSSRSASAAVGHSWRLHFGPDTELRVWRSGTTLVLRCPHDGAPRCSEQAGERSGTFTFELPGDYRAMAIGLGAAQTAPVSLDDDARAAGDQGVAYQLTEPITVY